MLYCLMLSHILLILRPSFSHILTMAPTKKVVDLGFDIAVVLCGVNDGKKFWQGDRCRCSPGNMIYTLIVPSGND